MEKYRKKHGILAVRRNRGILAISSPGPSTWEGPEGPGDEVGYLRSLTASLKAFW